MANKKDAYYFSHDSNARNDTKIAKLRSLYGAEGYGNYFMIVEMLREQSDFMLLHSSYDAIAFDLHSEVEKVKIFVKECINLNLFQSDEKYFWSDSLLSRMELKAQISKKMQKNAKKRWTSKSNAIAEQKHSKGNALKERKRKEKKEINTVSFLLPVELQNKITPEQWNEWQEYRNEIKKPLTQIAINKQVAFLLLQPNPAECLNTAIMNSWQGLFEVKSNGSTPQKAKQYSYEEYRDCFGELAKNE